MTSIVLESGLGSQYEDAPDSYEFPSRYRRFFDRVGIGEPLYAVIYEPRGRDQVGRMAYVGLAEIISFPTQTGRRNRAGEELWRVNYRRPVEPFDEPVPREVLGEPIETWLRDHPRGRARNVATFGRAVRSLADEDFERILRLAAVTPLAEEAAYPFPGDHREPLIAARERVQHIVEVYERRSAFRREVLDAYRYQCAITGLGLGRVVASKSAGVLDAAHIRPVGASGVDSVWNGLALTPTLHRLFDQGLFTLQYVNDHLEVLTSPRLDRRMVEVPERGVSLAVQDGTRLMLPGSPDQKPRRALVDYHRERIFIAS